MVHLANELLFLSYLAISLRLLSLTKSARVSILVLFLSATIERALRSRLFIKHLAGISLESSLQADRPPPSL
jgi:hypothetical protein